LYHWLRMWCDYLRYLYFFLKIEVEMCFKFDLREVLDIRDFLKETTSALKLRFDCILLLCLILDRALCLPKSLDSFFYCHKHFCSSHKVSKVIKQFTFLSSKSTNGCYNYFSSFNPTDTVNMVGDLLIINVLIVSPTFHGNPKKSNFSSFQSSKSEWVPSFQQLISQYRIYLENYKTFMNCLRYPTCSRIYFIFYESLKKPWNSIIFLKNWDPAFILTQLSLSLNNVKIALYANVPEVFAFNLKMSIQKYLIFCSWYNCFSANVSDFYTHFTPEN
jgi:hypothetical protein